MTSSFLVSSEVEMQSCAEVQTPSSVVPMGSTVTATCVIKDDCPLVIQHLEWRLADGLIPSSPVANHSHRLSTVVISNFNHSRAFLTCSVKASHQVIAGVAIRAGYPPEVPHNLRCQTNLTSYISLTCNWEPGLLETHLMTKYTLHTEIWDLNQNFSYELPPGVHHVTIPRPDFVLFSEMKVLVKAVNELGESTSASIMLEPVSAAKFDPPKIENIDVVPKRFGCLRLRWSLYKSQDWVPASHLNLEVRLRTVDGPRWSEPVCVPKRPMDQCRLLHGTQYFVQIRVRYKQSPWSEWSSSQSGVTLESAPTGRLDWWMKVPRDPKEVNVHLLWKPSKQFRANGQNVSFIVSLQKQGKGKVCTTRKNYCIFRLPGRAKRVYLSAVNAAGKSAPTEIQIYSTKADLMVMSEVTAVPQDEGLLVQWSSVITPPPTGYVLEWRPLLQTHPSHVQFENAARNQTHLLLTGGSLEPYQPYGISVYPRFKDGVGLPLTVEAYLSQKAPAMVPKIQIQKTWGSHVELTWDEIPLSQRNGIIQNYTIFYWDDKGHTQSALKLTLTDMSSESLYEVFMMVSTSGGSLNGSAIHFQIDPFDTVTVGIVFILGGIGLLLISLSVLKMEFWPAVPDPANSSIKKWTSDSTRDAHFPRDDREQNQIYLSHLSFLDLPLKLNKEDEDLWMSGAEDTSDLGESICGSPVLPSYSGSNTDSVPYATPHVYLRSESTQPLLEAEDSFTPKCYQNISDQHCSFFGPGHDGGSEDGDDPENLWDHFPFLRALAMNDHPN
uniref:Fibronectin type-III domain-containing protein n=1 Tax=Gouania willdenowi TaxID=441366 RepID=A0A8C5G316_GOUWI